MELNFKVLKLVMLVLIGIVLIATQSVGGLKCDRQPEGSTAPKTAADGRFRVSVVGNPQKYVPGDSYNISLFGTKGAQGQHKFIGFFLTSEKEVIDFRDTGSSSEGYFNFYGDTSMKFSEKCPNVVTHTSSHPRNDVQVVWVAPPAGTGCIVFRATVIEHRDIWFMDDDQLSKKFCEDEAESVDTQPSIVHPCNACEEAKYELTFEGLWSRHTHPKDFPSNGWSTKFSDIIGASHSYDYRFWNYGESASEGLKQVAEFGATKMLEGELKAESEHIRTIIKARGISYPNVTGKTFAVFRVDSKHHLVSLVSMLGPSPDWIVGVSGLELCHPNGSWFVEKVLNLYPWDAGTDSGPTYLSPDQPTLPQDAIRRIRTNFPNDPRSPFYDPTGAEMKPLARLYLSRQRLYERDCSKKNQDDDIQEKACATGPWGEWSSCNSACGKGRRYRNRSYLNPMLSTQNSCKKKLSQREECMGTAENDACEDDVDIDNLPRMTSPECEVTPFTPWSECSVECGKGVQTRTREYKNKKASKKCKRGDPSPPAMEETQECDGPNCTGDTPSDKNLRELHNPRCKMTGWSLWSPCSDSCGLGRRLRTRVPISKSHDQNAHHKRIVRLLNSRTRQNNDDEEDNDEEDDYNENTLDNGYMDENDPCKSTPTVEEVVCGHERPSCDTDIYRLPPFCLLEPKPGNCRNTVNRWYFNKNTKDCAVFVYTGCGSNNNNFLSREDCLSSCQRGMFANIAVRDQTINSDMNNGGKIVDCELSHWKRTQCNATCGEGFRLKSRTILKHPLNGGIPCTKNLFRYERCHVSCKRNNSNWNQDYTPSRTTVNCQYGEWSPWSPCNKSCGDYAIQQRTRHVLNPSHAHYCPHRLDERQCNIMPCLQGYRQH